MEIAEENKRVDDGRVVESPMLCLREINDTQKLTLR
jgi:hypothetical protein